MPSLHHSASATRHSLYSLTVILLMAILVYSPTLHAQEDSIANTAAWFTTTLPSGSYLLPVRMDLRDGGGTTGLLRDLVNDRMELDSSGVFRTVPVADVYRIILPGRKTAVSVGVHGAVIGAWLLNLLAMTRQDEPGSYVDTFRDDSSPLLLSTVLFAAATGGIAYLIGSAAEREEEAFVLGENSAIREEEFRRFERFVRAEPAPPFLHVTVETADVHPVETDRPQRLLRDAGYEPRTMYEAWEGYADSPFTLFRKVQATVSVGSGLAIGAAYMDLAEPQSLEYSGTDGSDYRHILRIEHEGSAWYAVATIEPLHAQLPRPFVWLLGAGIGASSLRGQLTLTSTQWSGPDVSVDTEQKRSLDARKFSALLFSEFRIFLYPSLSLGLTGEYVTLPTTRAAPLKGFSTQEPTFDFSAWSLGISAGLHF